MSMTWEELQVITLQKMFELQGADLVVDDSTGPYINAMPGAVNISIHTPHAGSDSKSYRIHIKFKNKIYDIRNKNKL